MIDRYVFVLVVVEMRTKKVRVRCLIWKKKNVSVVYVHLRRKCCVF